MLRLFIGLLFAVAAQVVVADEASVKKILESRAPKIPIDSVTKTPYFGLWEVRVGDELFYTDDKVTYIFSGSVLDGKTMKNLTDERLQKLSTIKYEDLPLNQAVKIVHGAGRRQLAVFEDPNCPYCKRFDQDMAKLDDVTIYIFLYPILSQNSIDKSKAVWCASDRAKAWTDTVLTGTMPQAALTCDTPIEKTLELGRKLRVDGTPTTFLPNGTRVVGARFADVQRELEASAK